MDFTEDNEEATYNSMISQKSHKPFLLQISPIKPDFGVVCQGFIYGMTITVFNTGLRPERLRVFCQPLQGQQNQMSATYEPCRLAPGMSTNIQLKIEAAHLCMSSCKLRIVQASTQVEESWIVDATVVPVETYKTVTKSLKVQGRSITADRVKALGQISHLDPSKSTNVSRAGSPKAMNSSTSNNNNFDDENNNNNDDDDNEENNKEHVPTKETNMFSKAFMDREEIEEIKEMPIMECMYYDPWEKKLKVDESMLSVDVDTQWTLDESKEVTQTRWANRLEQLEDKGMFSYRSGAALSGQVSMQNSITNSIENRELNEADYDN